MPMRHIVLAVALSALLVGCAKRPDDAQFKTYSELEKRPAAPSDRGRPKRSG